MLIAPASDRDSHVLRTPPPAVLAVAVALFAVACTPGTAVAQTPADPPAVAAIGADDLRQEMRKLWVEHVVWTRDYVIAALAGHPGADASLERLLRNQDDLGDAVVPFYGEDAGQALSTLLREHIEIAGELVGAAAAGDERGVAEADRQWHRNAADIATFLAEANPHWTRSDLLRMMNEHLALTTLAVTARLEGDTQREIAAFDRVLDQALEMADGLSAGLVRQFDTR